MCSSRSDKCSTELAFFENKPMPNQSTFSICATLRLHYFVGVLREAFFLARELASTLTREVTKVRQQVPPMGLAVKCRRFKNTKISKQNETGSKQNEKHVWYRFSGEPSDSVSRQSIGMGQNDVRTELTPWSNFLRSDWLLHNAQNCSFIL